MRYSVVDWGVAVQRNFVPIIIPIRHVFVGTIQDREARGLFQKSRADPRCSTSVISEVALSTNEI